MLSVLLALKLINDLAKETPIHHVYEEWAYETRGVCKFLLPLSLNTFLIPSNINVNPSLAFFQHFSYFTRNNPRCGYIDYVSYTKATSLNLTYASDSSAIIHVNDTNNLAPLRGSPGPQISLFGVG